MELELEQMTALEQRLAYLERQNRLMKRAVAVVLLIVGIGLIAGQITLQRHVRHHPPKVAPSGE